MAASGTHNAVRREPIAGLLASGAKFADRLPMLRIVLERAAAACTEELGKMVRPPVALSIERVMSGPAVAMLSPYDDGQCLVGVLDAPGWNSRVMVCADRGAVFAIVEALLGSDGSEPPFSDPRPHSKIEVRLVRLLFESVGRALEQAFEPIAATAFEAGEIGERVDFDAIGRRNNAVVLVRLRLEVLKRGGEILIAVPQAVLNPMREALSVVPEPEIAVADPRWSRQIQTEITRTSVRLTAVLDERMASLSEIAGLKVGQILPLNATPQSRVRVESNGEPLLSCQIGKSNGVYTLRVEGYIDKEQEFIDGLLAG
jgi:flagellar motor switch protein FliM